MTVVVFGSINIDLVVEVPHLPIKGETVIGNRFFSATGGKAANQAVAVAKLGVPVYSVGRVGSDSFGQVLLENLQTAGVDTRGVTIDPDTHSGVASIVIDERANNLVRERELQEFQALLPQTKVILLELGIPLPTIMEALRRAQGSNCTIILDPAPAQSKLPDELYKMVDIITPNEVEASQLVGFTVDGITTARQAASFLHQMGAKTVIITLGSQGAFCSTGEESYWVRPIPVKAVDTVAAGDAFNGALAVALAEGKSLREAVLWGNVAGALTVTKRGAQASLPKRDSFLELLAKQKDSN
jgi:ribokinase